jgi:hypothetical protein
MARRCRWDGRPTQPRFGSGGVAPQGVPHIPGPGPDPAEPDNMPAVDLRAGDGPVIYPPYTCAGDMPGSPGAKPAVPLRARCQADWRRSGVKNRETFHLPRPLDWPTLDRGAGKGQLPTGTPGNWTDAPAD